MASIDVTTIKRFRLFEGMSDDQFKVVSKVVKKRNIKEGEVIITEGEPGEELYLLLEGKIEITKRLVLFSSGETESKEKSLVRLEAAYNIFFGEMALFGDEKRSATVTALTDVTVGVLTRDDVDELLKEDPAMGYYLYYNIGQKIAANLRRANADILKLTTAFVMALEGK